MDGYLPKRSYLYQGKNNLITEKNKVLVDALQMLNKPDQPWEVTANGTMKFSKSKFVGKTWQKSTQIGIGKNKQSGETGVIGFKFDTTMVKRPIRGYLLACGWKKAGLFEKIRLKVSRWLG